MAKTVVQNQKRLFFIKIGAVIDKITDKVVEHNLKDYTYALSTKQAITFILIKNHFRPSRYEARLVEIKEIIKPWPQLTLF